VEGGVEEGIRPYIEKGRREAQKYSVQSNNALSHLLFLFSCPYSKAQMQFLFVQEAADEYYVWRAFQQWPYTFFIHLHAK
jgi:hypothetical protein